MYRLFVFLLISSTLAATDHILNLQGLPLQLVWADVDTDGDLDLVALMLVSHTEGQVDTWFIDGRVHGLYQDQTLKEKYLTTWLCDGVTWHQSNRMELGRAEILGFETLDGGGLALWKKDELLHLNWKDNAWQEQQRLPTPGLLAGAAASMDEFSFLIGSPQGPLWLVPDLSGMFITPLNHPEQQIFRPWPEVGQKSNDVSQGRHKIRFQLPKPMDLDGDGINELVFNTGQQLTWWPVPGNLPSQSLPFDGLPIDINGDGLIDRVQTEEDGEIDGPKDLPKMKTRIKTWLATEPLTYGKDADFDQTAAGMVAGTEDDSMIIPNPFLDLNNDGRPDLAGMAMKLSVFQMTKMVTLGRMNLKFLLQLNLQQEDGHYTMLAGSPFEMVWKINLRRLTMPSFAQMAADFDGDGWLDIMVDKDSRFEVTPVTKAGFQRQATWQRKIPKILRDADQIYGKDLMMRGRADFVLIKTGTSSTTIGILEPGQ